MRRNFSIGCLLLAWLCANGALWNAVQVVAWAKMFRDYAQVMPAARALRITFDGSAPCELCQLAARGQEAERTAQSREAAPPAAAEKILLVAETATPFVATPPDFTWPGQRNDAGLIRAEAVPVPPPRA